MTTLTQLADKEFLAEAQSLGGYKTKRETVNEALKEYIRWRKRIEEIISFPRTDVTAIKLTGLTQIIKLKVDLRTVCGENSPKIFLPIRGVVQ